MQKAQFPTRGNPYSQLERPVRVGKRTVVIPAHGDYSPRVDELVISIDAGPAFGTGTHPTTALCIGMIESYLKRGDLFLDVGTGSGILMIVSAKLGARKVYGIDKDKNALHVARSNLQLNGVEEDKFELRLGSLVEGARQTFDLIVANILTEVIIALLDDVRTVLKKTGCFVCSGMIEKNTHRILSKMKELDFELLEERRDHYWVSVAARRKE